MNTRVFAIAQKTRQSCGHGESIDKIVIAPLDPYGGPLPPIFACEIDAQHFINQSGTPSGLVVVEMVLTEGPANYRSSQTTTDSPTRRP